MRCVIARLPDQVVGHLELRVVGIVLGGRRRGCATGGLVMVEHDMEKVAVERAEEHIKTNLAEYLEKGVVK